MASTVTVRQQRQSTLVQASPRRSPRWSVQPTKKPPSTRVQRRLLNDDNDHDNNTKTSVNDENASANTINIAAAPSTVGMIGGKKEVGMLTLSSASTPSTAAAPSTTPSTTTITKASPSMITTNNGKGNGSLTTFFKASKAKTVALPSSPSIPSKTIDTTKDIPTAITAVKGKTSKDSIIAIVESPVRVVEEKKTKKIAKVLSPTVPIATRRPLRSVTATNNNNTTNERKRATTTIIGSTRATSGTGTRRTVAAANGGGATTAKPSSSTSASMTPSLKRVPLERWLNDISFDEQYTTMSSGATTSRWKKLRGDVGTINNGRVFIGVSHRAGSDRPMLGLFAGQAFTTGDVVTEYGGSLRVASDVRNEPECMWTHTRVIPGSIMVRDGLAHSLCFDRSKLHDAIPPSLEESSSDDRTEFRPSLLTAPRSPLPSGVSAHAIAEVICRSGLGYMSNTGMYAQLYLMSHSLSSLLTVRCNT
jgi:hypothetical protein